MTLGRRVGRLEAGTGFGKAPAACLIYVGGAATAHLTATGEQMPKGEYVRRWPQHPALKAYTDARMVDPLVADWSDAPLPRSSADV